MKTTNWDHLLDGLITATVEGRASWSRGDASDSWVYASPDGSVVVRRATGPVAEIQALGGPPVSVEVRSRADRTVDRLPTALERVGRMSSAIHVGVDADEPSPTEIPRLRQKAAHLLDAIVENHQDGSDVADAILRHLGA